MSIKDTSVKIKICGLKLLSELVCAADYGAKWYGMIFVKNSPRNISYKEADILLRNTPKSIKPIAVTVNPSLSLVNKLVKMGIKNIQLHGSESISYCLQLKTEYKLNIIKTISIHSRKDLKLVNFYKDYSDWVLFDYKDDLEFGGTGKSFDWNLLSSINLNFNWILSGGLDYNNVKEAIKVTGAKALDVSSGVEERKGKKSTELIKRFCNTVNKI